MRGKSGGEERQSRKEVCDHERGVPTATNRLTTVRLPLLAPTAHPLTTSLPPLASPCHPLHSIPPSHTYMASAALKRSL